MAYISFSNADGSSTLIEVDVDEVDQPQGVVKAGLGKRWAGTVAAAKESLDQALAAVIRANTQSFLHAVDSLPEAPDQIEISFAITATGEAGNLAVGKLVAEANYSVKLTWSNRDQSGSA